MSIHMRHYRSGGLYGIEYLFDEPGEGLRMHRHQSPEAHNIIVLSGEVLVYGPHGCRMVRGAAGAILDIDSSLRHEVMATQKGTRVLNMYLHGAPPGYLQLPESELTGHYASTMTHSHENGEVTMLPEWVGVFTPAPTPPAPPPPPTQPSRDRRRRNLRKDD